MSGAAVKIPRLPTVNGNGLPEHIARDLRSSFSSIQPAIAAAVAATQTGTSTTALASQLSKLATAVGQLSSKVTALYNSSIGVPVSQYPPIAAPLEDADYFIVSRDGAVLNSGTMIEILQYIIAGLLAQPAIGTALLGTDVFLVSPDGVSLEMGTLLQVAEFVLLQRSIPLSQFAPGLPTASQLLARWEIAETTHLVASLVGSAASAETAATGAISLPILQNATPIGTVDFAVSAGVATFTFAAPVTLVAGDVLKIQNAAVADATLADISFTLLGAAA